MGRRRQIRADSLDAGSTLAKHSRGSGFLFTEEAKEQVLDADVLPAHQARLLRGVRKNPVTFSGELHIIEMRAAGLVREHVIDELIVKPIVGYTRNKETIYERDVFRTSPSSRWPGSIAGEASLLTACANAMERLASGV